MNSIGIPRHQWLRNLCVGSPVWELVKFSHTGEWDARYVHLPETSSLASGHPIDWTQGSHAGIDAGNLYPTLADAVEALKGRNA